MPVKTTADNKLAGKRILVTRPAAQAGELIRAIQAAGAEPVALPLIEIQSLPDANAARQTIMDLDRYDRVIATSVNAARPGIELIDRYWPQVPPHIIWLAIGDATAAVLSDYGLAVKIPSAPAGSESLLAISELQQVADQRILILKGEGGRDLLTAELTRRGARVEILDLYRRVRLNYSETERHKIFQQGMTHILTVTSVETLQALVAVLGPVVSDLTELPLVVASQRIANAAHDMGFSKVGVANGADSASIMDALNVIA